MTMRSNFMKYVFPNNNWFAWILVQSRTSKDIQFCRRVLPGILPGFGLTQAQRAWICFTRIFPRLFGEAKIFGPKNQTFVGKVAVESMARMALWDSKVSFLFPHTQHFSPSDQTKPIWNEKRTIDEALHQDMHFKSNCSKGRNLLITVYALPPVLNATMAIPATIYGTVTCNK